MARVVVGMSGGVDSSVAAHLLLEQGHEVIGLFMKNWDEKDPDGTCPADQDFQDVLSVCDRLKMPCYSIEFIDEYRDNVFADFLKEYKSGRTPNPDVLCNREIKFDLFLKKAAEFGADFLATGHYARVAQSPGGPSLLRGLDANKDQTYFLTAVPRDRFSKVLFPIGDMEKSEVRAIARKIGLSTSEKKDSTGICFIGERKFTEFLGKYVQAKPGRIVDLDGKKVGEHNGIAFFTLGQRKGLGLGGEGEPWFVVGKNTKYNELIVVRGEEHPALYARKLIAHEFNWLIDPPIEGTEISCTAKTRYRQIDQPCVAHVGTDAQVVVQFKEPQRAMTPGQYVVLYQGDVCIGGGVIHETQEPLYVHTQNTQASQNQ
jgi:tRNA-uridine 2-sulfurtransferase